MNLYHKLMGKIKNVYSMIATIQSNVCMSYIYGQHAALKSIHTVPPCSLASFK